MDMPLSLAAWVRPDSAFHIRSIDGGQRKFSSTRPDFLLNVEPDYFTRPQGENFSSFLGIGGA